ncbi:DUF4168 domain-containing protein [Halovulum sp. GXIMD14794]
MKLATKMTRAAAVSTTALTVALAAPLSAQTTGEAPVQPAAPAAPVEAPQAVETAANYTDEKLEAFVSAISDVQDVSASYAEKLNGVSDQTEQQALVKEAQDAMVKAVEETPNITVQEYQEIGAAAQQDEALGQRIAAIVSQTPAE